MDPNAHDRFLLRQRIRPIVNQYEFSVLEEGVESQPFCFVEQKRFTLKEDIRFYASEWKQEELFRVKARQWFDPAARYDVAAGDERIGQILKLFGASLVRSTYVLYGADGQETARVQERSLTIAVIRRAAGLLPLVGDLGDWLPIPYHFEFRRGERLLGSHQRRTMSLRDVYTIDMTADRPRTLDRRLVLATAVCLDALQAR